MDLEAVVLILGLIGFGLTVWVWIWLRGLQRALNDGDGCELVRILAWIVGWSIVARIVGSVGVYFYNVDRGNVDLTLVMSIISQVLGTLIFVGAVLRVRRLSKPDRPGEAVVELHTQAASQVPFASVDIRPAVDNRNGDGRALPSERDQGPTGQATMGDSEEIGRQL